MSDETDTDDKPGFSLDLLVSLDASLGMLGLEMKRANDAAARARANLPRQLPMFRQATDQTATALLDFDGPQPGRKWEVRLLTTVSATLVAMTTTVTTWYVGQRMTGSATGVLPISMARWQFPSVPNFEDFSGDTISVLPGEKLYAGLTGIPAAPTQIGCLAIINDLPLFVGSAVQSA